MGRSLKVPIENMQKMKMVHINLINSAHNKSDDSRVTAVTFNVIINRSYFITAWMLLLKPLSHIGYLVAMF